MFKNYRFNWEDAWLLLLYAIAISIVIVLSSCFLSKKYTKGYSLGGDESSIHIVKEVEWDEDDKIPLDRSVTYEQAIELVERLNQTIKK